MNKAFKILFVTVHKIIYVNNITPMNKDIYVRKLKNFPSSIPSLAPYITASPHKMPHCPTNH